MDKETPQVIPPPVRPGGRADRDALLLWALLLAAFALRAGGIFDGLPMIFNADEPHFVNTAVYFGGGTLNPPFLKYPTLWIYSLFASYIGLFLAWSGCGFFRSAGDFGVKFASDPSMFYITGRLLACAVSCAAVWVVYRAGLLLWSRRAALAGAALFAFLPSVVEAAQYAKWESLMLLLSAAAWYFAIQIYREGRRRDYLLCGLALGLCVSTHYIAGLFCLLLPVAHIASFMKSGGTGFARAAADSRLWAGLALIPCGFLIGTPYALLDFHKFKSSMSDIAAYSALRNAGFGFREKLGMAGLVLDNLLNFAGKSPAPLIFIAAVPLLAAETPWLALLLAAPVAVYIVFLSSQHDGGFPRYLFNSLPALCLVTAGGIEKLSGRFGGKALFAALFAAAALPAFAQSAALLRYHWLPDTRILAGEWIAQNVPAGTAILTDQPHLSPYIAMSGAQTRRLYEKALRAGNPRAKFYEYLLKSGLKDGYRIYRIDRSAADLAVLPAQLQSVKAAQELADISAGLDGVKKVGIKFVALPDEGRNPEHRADMDNFERELSDGARIAASFGPARGKIKGPGIVIYRID